MDEFIKYGDSDIKIDVLGSDQDQLLSINYVVKFQTSGGKIYELTAADYYYEALELMLINKSYKDKGCKQHLKQIDRFRDLIYATLTLLGGFKFEKKESIFESIRNISRNINEYFTHFIDGYQDGESNFEQDIDHFKQDIDRFEQLYNGLSQEDQENNEVKRTLTGKGCVAVAYDNRDESKWYFSLSGSSFDYKGKNNIYNINRKKWSFSDKMEDAYRVVGEALKKVYKKEPKECHLTDDTRRYVRYGGIFLSPSVTLENDVKHNSKEVLNLHYSCCERKILTYIEKNGFVNPDYLKQSADNILKHYTFIIRYDPCKKCMPALFGCENIITGKGNRKIVKNNNVFECKPL